MTIAFGSALRASADVVVADTAALPAGGPASGDRAAGVGDAAVLAAVEEADAVLLVGSAEPPQLVRLIASVKDLGRTATVAVTRVRSAVAGPRPAEAIASVLARHTALTELWPLPWDPDACDAALREARTLGEVAPRSSLRRAVASVATAVLADARAASRPAGAAVPD